MSHALRLRDAVEVTFESGILSFADRDIELSIEIEIGKQPELVALNRKKLECWLQSNAPDAEQVVQVLCSLAMLDEGSSRVEIRKKQTLFQLNQLLEFTKQHVPFYEPDTYPSAVASLQEMATLPLLRKSDVRGRFLDLVSGELDLASGISSGEVSLGSTSGSTGERLQSLSGPEVAQNPASYDYVWFGRAQGRPSKVAILTTPICSPTVCHLGRASYEERLIENGAVLTLNSCEDLFGVERSQIKKFADDLHRFRPDIVFCNPMYLHWFGRKATEWGIALPPVKALSSSYQYRSLLQTRGLHQVFGAPIYDYYGCTEAAATPGQECPNGRLHVRSEQCLVEVVNEQGGPVPLQTLGAIVITTTAARTMPLVRYMVGDVGCLQEADCSCVLGGCPTIVLHGRAKDMLYLQNRWVTTRQFDDVIGTTDHLDFYSCKQLDERTLQVKVIPFLGYEGSFPYHEVAEKVSSAFSVANVIVEDVHRLDPLPGSLKFALTQCRYREPPACP